MTPQLFALFLVMLMALKLSSFKAQAHRAIPVLPHPWQAGIVISAQKTGTCPGTGLCIIADVVNGICVNCGKPRPKR